MVRAAGAREVHFRVASPMVISPCFYGMDFPDPKELVANRFDQDPQKIGAWLGVDSLEYLSHEGLLAAVRASSSTDGFCSACFSGIYPVPVELGVTKDENDW
jgi:amidophosphoribosyltransferase